MTHDQRFVPAWVMEAILGMNTCTLCGEPIITGDRTIHVICELVQQETQ